MIDNQPRKRGRPPKTAVPQSSLSDAEIRLRCLEIVQCRGLTANSILSMDQLIGAAKELEKYVKE